MAKKPKLPPIRSRMKWVYDQYAERDPFVWLYTYAAIRGLRTDVYAGGTIVPFESYLTWTMAALSPEISQRDPSEVGSAMQAAGIERLNPPMQGTVEQMWQYVMRWQLVDVLTGEWSSAKRWACAKVVPAVARWVREIVARDGAAARLAMQWEMPWSVTLTHAELSEPARGEIISLFGQLPSICDWYEGARPDLARYKTWVAASQAAQDWHRSLTVSGESGLEQGPIVFKWPDGWTIQELVSWTAFREEGRSLGHCLANSRQYYDDARAGESVFLSLRTPGNQPWLTFEVVAPRGFDDYVRFGDRKKPSGSPTVQQIKGCKNRMPGVSAPSRDCPDPDPSECARVFDFLQHMDWYVGPDYKPCWVTAVRLLGLSNEKADPAPYPARKLLEVKHPDVQPGTPTERAKKIEGWWE